jgi:hypothetical protein
VEGFILRTCRKNRGRRIWSPIVLALLITAKVAIPAFADVSPEIGSTSAGVQDNSPVQLAQANLPALGGVDDYMHQDGDGPSASTPPQGYQQYQPQAGPPPGMYPQGGPQTQWNYGETDPGAERSALIGAAVVGAVAVGLWAWQQHEMHQAQLRARKRYYSHQRAFD